MIVLTNLSSPDDAFANPDCIVTLIDMSSRTIIPGEASSRYFRETYLGDGIRYIQTDGSVYPSLTREDFNLWYSPDGNDRWLAITQCGDVYLTSKQGIIHWMEGLGQTVPIELGMAPRNGQVWT